MICSNHMASTLIRSATNMENLFQEGWKNKENENLPCEQLNTLSKGQLWLMNPMTSSSSPIRPTFLYHNLAYMYAHPICLRSFSIYPLGLRLFPVKLMPMQLGQSTPMDQMTDTSTKILPVDNQLQNPHPKLSHFITSPFTDVMQMCVCQYK